MIDRIATAFIYAFLTFGVGCGILLAGMLIYTHWEEHKQLIIMVSIFLAIAAIFFFSGLDMFGILRILKEPRQ